MGFFLQCMHFFTEPPSRLYFHGPIYNKLEGTEGSVLVIRCIADGGKPPPDVSILDTM